MNSRRHNRKAKQSFGLNRAVGSCIAFALLFTLVLALVGGERWVTPKGRSQIWQAGKSMAISGLRTTRNALAATRDSMINAPEPDDASRPPIIFRPAYPGAAPYPADPQCIARMTGNEAHSVTELAPMTPAPRANNPCGSNDPLEVKALAGVQFSSPVVMGCKASEALAKWLDQDLPKLAERQDISVPTKLYHMGTYNCRKISGSRNWSQHAFANAIDISGFHVPELGRVDLKRDYLVDIDQADEDDEIDEKALSKATLLKGIRNSLCRRFNVVLSPEFNAAHADHFHVDLGPYRICR